MKDWSKYYTPDSVAQEIVSKIPDEFIPSNVIDICAGSGNLLSAAEKRWGNANYISVDISDNNVLMSNYNFYQLDALDFIALNKLVKFKIGKRLILANPPFGSISPSKENLIINNDFLGCYVSDFQQLNRAEASMLISNLSLLRKGDVFGALLPENIFSSEKFYSFRTFFLDLFDICYIGTSNQYFSGSEVKTRQFIGVYKGMAEISDATKKNENEKEIIKIYRGIDNSKLLKGGDIKDLKNYSEVLHFNNPEGLILSKKYIHISKLNAIEIVHKNDLLIIRVGRNSGRIVKPNASHIGKLVSDHLFIIKSIPKKLSKKQLNLAERYLVSSKKGLTASYISKTDVNNALKNIF